MGTPNAGKAHGQEEIDCDQAFCPDFFEAPRYGSAPESTFQHHYPAWKLAPPRISPAKKIPERGIRSRVRIAGNCESEPKRLDSLFRSDMLGRLWGDRKTYRPCQLTHGTHIDPPQCVAQEETWNGKTTPSCLKSYGRSSLPPLLAMCLTSLDAATSFFLPTAALCARTWWWPAAP